MFISPAIRLLSIFFLIIVSVHSGEMTKGEVSHNKFYLNVGQAEGSFSKYTPAEFLIYENPSKKAKLLYTLKPKDYDHPAGFLKLFDDKKSVFYFMNISSTEKKDGFYKIYYKGKYHWAPESNFYQKMPIHKYMSHKLFSLKTEIRLLEKPKGKVVLENLKAIPRFEDEDKRYMDAEILDHKYIKGNLWLKVNVGRVSSCDGEVASNAKSYTGWVKPYDENGAPLWIYPYKGC